MRFVESTAFTAKVQTVDGGEEALRVLQILLAEHPETGKVITGTGGFRKVRMAIGHGGKSGGARVVYLFLPELPCIVFVLLYTKREADTISPAGKDFLRQAAADLKAQQHLLP